MSRTGACGREDTAQVRTEPPAPPPCVPSSPPAAPDRTRTATRCTGWALPAATSTRLPACSNPFSQPYVLLILLLVEHGHVPAEVDVLHHHREHHATHAGDDLLAERLERGTDDARLPGLEVAVG